MKSNKRIREGKKSMTEMLPKDDTIFKMIFGDPKHPRILIHFLNSIVESKSKIKNVEILQSEITPEFLGMRGVRLDVVAKTEEGELINIEIQKKNEGNMTARSLFYWSKLFAGQLNVSEEYSNLKRTVSINILDFTLFKEDDRYWRKGHIRDDFSNEKFTDLLEMHFLELNKMREVSEESPITFWLEFIRSPYSERVKKICEFVPEIREAKKVLDKAQSDPKARELHRIREKGILDTQHALSMAKKEGRAEGKEEGKQEGLAEGESKGELKKARETATNLLSMGLSIEQISKATGLSVKEIERLKK